mgnify:CR=1 FL=1
MNENERKKLKEKCIKMYLEDHKTLEEIAKLTNWSRTFITNLIKNDERYIKEKNTRKIKVSKRKERRQLAIYIPTEFIEKLGISRDIDKTEYVNISLAEDNKTIIIKKHS